MANTKVKVNKVKFMEALEQKGLSRNKLSKLMGIESTNFYKAWHGRSNFFPKWRILISEILETPEQELFPEFAQDAKGGE